MKNPAYNMLIQDFYRWEAEMSDGSMVTGASPSEQRGDLTDCVRFSLIPASGLPHPRHDITGVKLVRRFCRGFHKTPLHRRRELPGLLFWEDGARIMKTTQDWRELLDPGDWIGKGVAGDEWYVVQAVHADRVELESPYHGKTKINGMFCRMIKNPVQRPTFIYLHCVEGEDFRIWVNYATGEAKVTAVDYEEYM